jgi:hypothetical protein
MAIRDVIRFYDDFIGQKVVSATADASGWVKNETKTSGSPSVATVTGESTGAIALTCDSTNEVQAEVLYSGDVLSLNGANLQTVSFNAKVATVGTNSTVILGVASAHNATPTSISHYAWFKLVGGNTLTVGINGNDGVSTGITLTSGTYVGLKIDFTHGLSDVRFYAENSTGQLTRVAGTTTFDISAYTGSFQPYMKSGKASSTDTPVLTVDVIDITYKR